MSCKHNGLFGLELENPPYSAVSGGVVTNLHNWQERPLNDFKEYKYFEYVCPCGDCEWYKRIKRSVKK